MSSDLTLESDLALEDKDMGQDKLACEFDTCEKIFKSKKSLKEHTRIHNDEKPYSCAVSACGRAFTQYSSLQKHNRTHNGERPYICDLCNQSFTQLSNLKRHERVHNKERPYVCESCSKSYANFSNLKQHQQTHMETEVRNKYQCNLCEKSYNYSNSLKKHLKVHHNTQTPSATPDNIMPFAEDCQECNSHNQQAGQNIYPISSQLEGLISNMEETKNTDIAALENAFNNYKYLTDNMAQYIQIAHQGHIDYLANRKLQHVNEYGFIEEHHLELTDQNPTSCKPVKEITHVSSLMWLFSQYENYIKQKQIPLTQDMIINTCNILTCSKLQPFNSDYTLRDQISLNQQNNFSYTQAHEKAKDSFICLCLAYSSQVSQPVSCQNGVQNNMLWNPEVEKVKKENCFCEETLFLKHKHDESCGHPQIWHDGHIDYIVEGHLHHVHGNHCDDHGNVLIVK